MARGGGLFQERSTGLGLIPLGLAGLVLGLVLAVLSLGLGGSLAPVLAPLGLASRRLASLQKLR